MTRDAGAGYALEDVGAVAIGRNEGERLRRCLLSLVGKVRHVVYVDSGSTDGSVALARALGAHVVELDLSQPFTAARARNIGFTQLQSLGDEFAFVQFVDGDCEVEEGWIKAARDFFSNNANVGVVLGRRRERFPARSVYNGLCDLEWQIPPGEVKSCGGDAMMRLDMLAAAGGYRSDLIAGEEPELCVRLRRAGWKVVCIDQPMTIHDAAITRFSQWWRRSVRSGYAFVQGTYLHGRAPENLHVSETRRSFVWGAGLPALFVGSWFWMGPWAFLFALPYPAQVGRLYWKRRGQMPIPFAASFLHVLGRFPEAIGQVRFVRDFLFGRTRTLIEYK